jgi:Cu/Ag efflux pump CusA
MLHAAQRRLRPIVMTALAAVCGMLPLAFALGAGSQMLQPLAIAVIGGSIHFPRRCNTLLSREGSECAGVLRW